MNAETRHDDVAPLLGAYALDAVDPAERAEVDRHLVECPRCRAEVDAHLEMAGALGNGVEVPPADLWDRIADRLPDSPRLSAARPMPPLASPAPGGTGAGEPGPDRADDDELARARADRASHSSRAVLRVAAVAAAAAVIVIAVLAVNLSRVDNRVGQIQSAVGRQGTAAVINQALANPHRLVSLASPSGVKLAEFVVTPDGRGYMVKSAMPPLPSDQTYQLWAFISGRPISLGLLGNRPSQAGFTVAGTPAPTSLAVTIEPAGGVASPDRAPVAAGRLTSA